MSKNMNTNTGKGVIEQLNLDVEQGCMTKEQSVLAGWVEVTDQATPTMNEYKCTVCLHEFTSAKSVNVRCPMCHGMAKVRLFPKLDNYVVGLGVTVNDRDTVDIGDQVAGFLRGLSPEDVLDVVGEYLDMLGMEAWSSKAKKQRSLFTGTTTEWLAAKYEGKNEGMIRMNCGNVLRSALGRIA